MRKLAVGLLAAAGVAFAMPANAQGLWFGVGPFGIEVGAAPYAYDYGPYWGGPYAYSAPAYSYETTYSYAPGYGYGPTYDVSYGYPASYGYGYEPDYSYGERYADPAYSYGYGPQYRYRAPVAWVSGTTSYRRAPYVHASVRHVQYRTARISREAYRAQASVPMHSLRHVRHLRVDRDNTGQGVRKVTTHIR
jgi:hypothetical protein